MAVVVVVLPPFLRILFVVISPSPLLYAILFFFNLFSFAVCVSALSKMKRKKNALLVFVKEEIKRRTFLLLRAENAPCLSLSLCANNNNSGHQKPFSRATRKVLRCACVYKYVSRAIATFFNFLLDLLLLLARFLLLRVWENCSCLGFESHSL